MFDKASTHIGSHYCDFLQIIHTQRVWKDLHYLNLVVSANWCEYEDLRPCLTSLTGLALSWPRYSGKEEPYRASSLPSAKYPHKSTNWRHPRHQGWHKSVFLNTGKYCPKSCHNNLSFIISNSNVRMCVRMKCQMLCINDRTQSRKLCKNEDGSSTRTLLGC